MARLNHVVKARKAQGTCSKCGKPIEAGTAYTWWQLFRSPKRKVHGGVCTGKLRRSEYATDSDKLGRLWDAEDDADAAIQDATTADELAEVLNSAAEKAREVGEEYQESRDNMPERLQEGPTGEEIGEKVEACETWADELESVACNMEDAEQEGDESKEEMLERLTVEASDAISSLET